MPKPDGAVEPKMFRVNYTKFPPFGRLDIILTAPHTLVKRHTCATLLITGAHISTTRTHARRRERVRASSVRLDPRSQLNLASV